MPVTLTDGFEDVASKLREPILQATNLYVQGHPLRATLTPGGFLVQGRPGTGKSTVVRRVAGRKSSRVPSLAGVHVLTSIM
jgi:ATP-dependent 26S proteasome regulatory subunit